MWAELGECIKTAKYPVLINTILFICGACLAVINSEIRRLGILLILLSILGYAIIFTYCQVPADEKLFAPLTSHRRSSKNDTSGGTFNDDTNGSRRKSLPMKFLSVVQNVSRNAYSARGSVCSTSSAGYGSSTVESRKEISEATVIPISTPVTPVIECELVEEVERKPILGKTSGCEKGMHSLLVPSS